MNTLSQVPPGFRFHPTDEELVDCYLRKKVNARRIELDIIKDIDLYKIEPWDLPELCGLGTEDQNEWYFFSHKDKKYPTGTRTNRATTAGFWKATGRDKAIYLKHELIGMRKTLVFYKGRAPNGQKSDWIMHEYRLQSEENGPPQEEGWAVCRVFKKKMTTVRRTNEHESSCWFNDQLSFMPNLDSLNDNTSRHNRLFWHPCKKEIDQYHHHPRMHYTGDLSDCCLSLPHFDVHNRFLRQENIPTPNNALNNGMMLVPFDHEHQMQQTGSHDNNMHQLVHGRIHNDNVNDQQTVMDGEGSSVTVDWRILDKIVTSQFCHEDNLISSDNNEKYLNARNEQFHISDYIDTAGPREYHNAIVSDSMQQDSEHQQPESTTSASATYGSNHGK